MGRLIWGLLAIALLWDGIWLMATGALRSGAATAISASAGQIEAADVRRTGFPLSFGLRAQDLTLKTADGLAEWTLPKVVFKAPGLMPHQPSLRATTGQTLRVAGETVMLDFDEMRADAAFAPSGDLTLETAGFFLTAPKATAASGWLASAEAVEANLRPGTSPETVDISAEVRALTLPAAALAALNGAVTPGTLVDRIGLKAQLTLSAPLDRHIGQTKPQITAVDLGELALRWGEMALAAQGQVTITAAGQPEGRLMLRATRWREMLDMAVAAGLVKAETAPTVAAMLTEMAQASGGESLDLPIDFRAGLMFVGPIPVGPAPYLQ